MAERPSEPESRPAGLPLLDLYRAEIGLLLQWHGGSLALIRRLLMTLTLSTIALGLTASLVPGIRIDGSLAAISAVIAMTLFNAGVRPILLALAAPVSVLLVGAVALVLQVALFCVVAPMVPGVHVDGLGPAFIGAWVLATINAILTGAFSLDRGDTFYGRLVRQWALRSVPRTSEPGVIIIQLDGLAYPVLAGRIRAGYLPALSSLVRSGSHRLNRWEPLLPSMTSASQAGILFGSNDGIPAFRWYERDRRHLMVSNDPDDAAEIARRLSMGDGLLSAGGASIGNLFSGDAPRSFVTASTLADPKRRFGDGHAFLWFFLNPTAYLRLLLLFVREFVGQRLEARRLRRSGITPRAVGGLHYAVRRAISTMILRELNTSLVVEEMFRSTPVIYVDFADYDEIAHHTGPERFEALRALDRIDDAVGMLLAAATDAPRPYRFVFLSDHGQSLGATFAQRYGKSLTTLVQEYLGGTGATANGGSSDLVVAASGNLALVYLGSDRRLTLEEIDRRHPNLVQALSGHPGIGLLLVQSRQRGPLAIGQSGTRELESGRIDGADPTEPYGPHTAMSLLRENAMTHAPDILLLSRLDAELGEVAAFEDLIGSHGGLGGFQTEAFVLHPADWTLDEHIPLGAPALHRNLRRWLTSIGIGFGAVSSGVRTNSSATTSSGLALPDVSISPAVAGAVRPESD